MRSRAPLKTHGGLFRRYDGCLSDNASTVLVKHGTSARGQKGNEEIEKRARKPTFSSALHMLQRRHAGSMFDEDRHIVVGGMWGVSFGCCGLTLMSTRFFTSHVSPLKLWMPRSMRMRSPSLASASASLSRR